MKLNRRARMLADDLAAHREELGIAVVQEPGCARLIDCGVATRGGLEAGRRLAEISMAGLGQVRLAYPLGHCSAHEGGADASGAIGVIVTVQTDQPLLACMASQYAGWRVKQGSYFAMASGPMRGLAALEPIFARIGPAEREAEAVGILESAALPPADVCNHFASQCGVEPVNVTLLAARTKSLAGTVQVVARSVETALHKLFELGYDLGQVESGFGAAPLPPAARNDLSAMGRTNDAILYGGEVTLWLRGELEQIAEIGARVPSSASADHGTPFVEIFERYGGDFYKIDPHLFAPAVIKLVHSPSGRMFVFGQRAPEVLRRSFTS